MRQDHEPPPAIARLGWRYHHVGIPTAVPRAGERYLPEYRLYVEGFDKGPYGIEWMRFEPGSPVSELIRTVPHVASESGCRPKSVPQARAEAQAGASKVGDSFKHLLITAKPL